MRDKKTSNCDDCMNYEYDEEFECFSCSANLDEDEMFRFMTENNGSCPYYRSGDEYTIVRKQI